MQTINEIRITFQELCGTAIGKKVWEADRDIVKLLRLRGWNGICSQLYKFLMETGDAELQDKAIQFTLYLNSHIAAIQAAIRNTG